MIKRGLWYIAYFIPTCFFIFVILGLLGAWRETTANWEIIAWLLSSAIITIAPWSDHISKGD